jgi:hypothetical protein
MPGLVMLQRRVELRSPLCGSKRHLRLRYTIALTPCYGETHGDELARRVTRGDEERRSYSKNDSKTRGRARHGDVAEAPSPLWVPHFKSESVSCCGVEVKRQPKAHGEGATLPL